MEFISILNDVLGPVMRGPSSSHTAGSYHIGRLVPPGPGLRLRFRIARLDRADHPNTVRMELVSRSGRRLEATAKSVGGGMIALTELDGWPVLLDGKSHEVMVLSGARQARTVERILAADGQLAARPGRW